MRLFLYKIKLPIASLCSRTYLPLVLKFKAFLMTETFSSASNNRNPAVMCMYSVLITGGFWGTCKGILLCLIIERLFQYFRLAKHSCINWKDPGSLLLIANLQSRGAESSKNLVALQKFHGEPVTSCFTNLAYKLYEIVKCVYTELGKLLDKTLA